MKHKGLDYLFAALADDRAQTLSLAIAGSGPDEQLLRVMAREKGIEDRVFWLGHQKPSSFLASVGAIALLSRYEAQPLTLLEAQAAQVPVVASPWAGADPDSPIVAIVDPRDHAATADELSRQSQRGNLSGAKPSHTYSTSDMANKYIEVLSSLSKGPRMRFRRSTAFQ